MADLKQPEPAIALPHTAATPEQGIDCSKGSDPSQESMDSDFELLWRLRKYLVLLGILAVSVTYNAGLSPPGGFWSGNVNGPDGHSAGDPVLHAKFFLRDQVFFYCNATAFAASLVLIILLLSKNVTSRMLWLRSMQLTMILDLFSLMGAYAAGSCRALKSSIYIWVLVFAVFVYIMIHILVFISVVPNFVSGKRFVPKWLKEKVQSVQCWIQSKCGFHKSQRNSPQENDLEEARKFILMLVSFAATVTYQAGLSPPGGFWAENDENKIPATSMLRSENLARYNTFVVCNSTSFVASLVTVILLLSPQLSKHGIRSRAVIVCVVVDLLGLITAYAAGSCRSVATSICVILITVVVWICFALLAGTFVHRPVADWLKKIKPDIDKYMDTISRVFSLKIHRNILRNREGGNIASSRKTGSCKTDATETESTSESKHHIAYDQHVPDTKEGESDGEHQTAGKHQMVNTEEVVSGLQHALMSASESKHHVAYDEQVSDTEERESHGEHQTAGKHQMANTEELVSGSEQALMSDEQSENSNDCMYKLEERSTQSEEKEPMSKTENPLTADTKEQSSSMDALKTTNPAAKETISKIGNASMKFPEATNTSGNISTSEHQSTENLQHVNVKQKPSSMDDLKTTNPMDGTSIFEHESADCNQVGNMTWQSSSNNDHKITTTIMEVVDMSKDIMLTSVRNGATNDLTAVKESIDVSRKAIKDVIVEINDDTSPITNGNIEKNDESQGQDDRNGNDGDNATDEHLKKSRTYLLLLGILAVSLTYQSGLNPPGAFWSNSSTGDHQSYHLPGDPILEDTHHRRYIAFFYLNAIAFVASLVMIVMLLHRRMSNKVIKRYALQTAMIVDLLALTGSYVMGSCRETKNSIYISLLVCLVLAYVVIHVLIAIHVIPEWWKKTVAGKIENFACRYIWEKKASFGHNKRNSANEMDSELGHNQSADADDKYWERRRNLLLMLAVLTATVTYQAGMNPPGGVWSDDMIKPGDPILQQNNVKRYDVFYYSNSLSFVSSVVITILLVNKESCEHGIKSYALRVCLVLGLVGLLIAYAAGSCRKERQSIYLIIIAVAVLISLVTQVLLLSSTQGTLGGKLIERFLQLLSCIEPSQVTTPKKKESSDQPKKKGPKKYKYLMLLAILSASITYQAGLNPPGGFWSDDDEGHVAGNPVLLDMHPLRYKIFFWFNSISLMTSIVVIMFLLNRSVWKKDVPLWVLRIIMVVDLLALMTAFAAGSCRRFRTSVYVNALVIGVVLFLVIVMLMSSGIANHLTPRKRSVTSPQRSCNHTLETSTPVPGQQV
ncbi:hypothetical protein HU200_060154 [Digitaria exilis]|uniref:PGG domain-containing protein n=1 Tax=Digitaria exilis TaxID=1010633 RepID=A0A835A712_9POAL|nr:hypothetical protein HU200_060154 [Digitaria exilis]